MKAVAATRFERDNALPISINMASVIQLHVQNALLGALPWLAGDRYHLD